MNVIRNPLNSCWDIYYSGGLTNIAIPCATVLVWLENPDKLNWITVFKPSLASGVSSIIIDGEHKEDSVLVAFALHSNLRIEVRSLHSMVSMWENTTLSYMF